MYIKASAKQDIRHDNSDKEKGMDSKYDSVHSSDLRVIRKALLDGHNEFTIPRGD